ncbi:MAG: hypothetical protein ACI90V_000217 [Bacillariaceae sp.]|jgi:hypothetical protein
MIVSLCIRKRERERERERGMLEVLLCNGCNNACNVKQVVRRIRPQEKKDILGLIHAPILFILLLL